MTDTERQWLTLRQVSRDFGLSLNMASELARSGQLRAKRTEAGEVLVAFESAYSYCKRRGLQVPDVP